MRRSRPESRSKFRAEGINGAHHQRAEFCLIRCALDWVIDQCGCDREQCIEHGSGGNRADAGQNQCAPRDRCRCAQSLSVSLFCVAQFSSLLSSTVKLLIDTSSYESSILLSAVFLIRMRASQLLLLVAGLLALCLALTASPACGAGPNVGPLPLNFNPIGPQFISSTIVWALLVGLFLLFVLYIGVNCITNIERPVRLSAVPLQLAKEY
jgi:hypothetical protein